jgi:hypothetical protein
MAEPKPNVMTLPADVRKRLTEQAPDLERARNAVNTLKKLGMDTTSLEEKLTWAEETRKTLLSEFG